MNTIPTVLPPLHGLRQAWRRLGCELFDDDGLDVLFSYARNLLTGTVIVAAGLHAARHAGPSPLPQLGVPLHVVGWIVSCIGIAMLVIYLAGGLRRLALRQHHLALRVLAGLLYVGVSLRLTQVIVLFRSGL